MISTISGTYFGITTFRSMVCRAQGSTAEGQILVQAWPGFETDLEGNFSTVCFYGTMVSLESCSGLQAVGFWKLSLGWPRSTYRLRIYDKENDNPWFIWL